jgi:hypothetical protein
MWQKINVVWHYCHSWQDHARSMITAMTTILLLALVVAAILGIAAATVRSITHDGRGSARPPRSHFEDPRFVSYSAR